MSNLEDLQQHGSTEYSPHTAVSQNVRQHRETLSRLAESLRKLGLDEAEIDEHVSGLLGQYERELGHSIRQIELAKTFSSSQ